MPIPMRLVLCARQRAARSRGNFPEDKIVSLPGQKDKLPLAANIGVNSQEFWHVENSLPSDVPQE